MIRVLEFADVINRHDFIETIVNYADRERFEVSVCVRTEESNIAPPVFPPGTRYRLLEGNRRSDALRTARRLAGLLREWEIDVLHTHHFEQAYIGWLATRLWRRTRLVIGRHYSDAIYRNPNPLKRRGLLAIEQIVNRAADRIIVPSKMIRDLLIGRQRIDPEKIDLVHYGFVEEKFPPPSAEKREHLVAEFMLSGRLSIASFGRYQEEKGYTYLLDAIDIARGSIPNLVWLCVGEGHLRAELERLITERHLSNHVVLTGWRRDAMAIMDAVDLVVHPSLSEAFSQVMCEAMWMRKPLIMTDVSGAADVIEDGVNGRIVPKEDAGALALAILELAADAGARERLGRNARAYIEEHLTIEKQIGKYEAAFERALGAA